MNPEIRDMIEGQEEEVQEGRGRAGQAALAGEVSSLTWIRWILTQWRPETAAEEPQMRRAQIRGWIRDSNRTHIRVITATFIKTVLQVVFNHVV